MKDAYCNLAMTDTHPLAKSERIRDMGRALLLQIKGVVDFTEDDGMRVLGFSSYLDTSTGNGFGNNVKEAAYGFRVSILFKINEG
jgi:hypothetical protein